MLHSFPKDINQKVNVIARLEFKVTHSEAVIQHFNQFITGIPPHIIRICLHSYIISSIRSHTNMFLKDQLGRALTSTIAPVQSGLRSTLT